MKRFTSPEGFRRMQRLLDEARATYDAVVAGNPEAAEAGDNSVWHDNFAFEENQRQMHQWAKRVADLRELVSSLQVITPGPRPDRVGIGTRVELRDAGTGELRIYLIGGFDDGDLSSRRLAYNTPLAEALMEARVGESRTVTLPGGEREYEVVSIEPAEEAA